MRSSLVLCSAGLLFCTASLAAQQDTTLAIFIRPTALEGNKRQRLDERPQKELERQLSAAQDSVAAMDKEFKKLYGKKRDAWPAEAESRMRAAERVGQQAAMHAHYSEAHPEDVKRVQGWLSEAVAKRGGLLREVPAEVDADVVIDVRGTWSTKTVDSYIGPDVCRILFSVQPGGRASAELLGKLPDSWEPTVPGKMPGASRIAGSGPPQTLLLESGNRLGAGIRGCWSGATDGAMAALTELRGALRAAGGP